MKGLIIVSGTPPNWKPLFGIAAVCLAIQTFLFPRAGVQT
jgi:hypothetical protein